MFVSAHVLSQFAGDAVAGYRVGMAVAPRERRADLRAPRHASRVSLETSTCVERLLRARQAIGSRCAEPRAVALPPDPQVEAARAPGDDRVRLLDLSDFMCTATLCPPVVGGALVLKDADHLTRAFSTTLGPYLLRASANARKVRGVSPIGSSARLTYRRGDAHGSRHPRDRRLPGPRGLPGGGNALQLATTACT